MSASGVPVWACGRRGADGVEIRIVSIGRTISEEEKAWKIYKISHRRVRRSTVFGRRRGELGKNEKME